MTPEEVRILYDYNTWANRRELEAASALTPEQFVKPLGSSFSSVRDTLAHICGAEWIWLERFQGRSPASLPDTTQFKDVPSLRAHWDELEARLLKFVRELKQTDLDRVFEYKTLKFGVYHGRHVHLTRRLRQRRRARSLHHRFSAKLRSPLAQRWEGKLRRSQ